MLIDSVFWVRLQINSSLFLSFGRIGSYIQIFECVALTPMLFKGRLYLEFLFCQLGFDVYVGNSMVWAGPAPLCGIFFPARLQALETPFCSSFYIRIDLHLAHST